MDYVPYARLLKGNVALLSTHLLDMDSESIDYLLKSHLLADGEISKVIVHYPPVFATTMKELWFWTPNEADRARMNVLRQILELRLRLKKDAKVYFGHVCLGADDDRMSNFPGTLDLSVRGRGYKSIWVKPGTVLRISPA